MHSKRKGNIGEMHVAACLAKLGYSVFRELGDISRIDLIAEVGKSLVRIQVKYTSVKKDGFILSTRKCSTNYQYLYGVDDVDVFAVYCAEENKVVWVLASDILVDGKHTCLTFRSKTCPPKNNQKSKVRFIEDHEDFEKVIAGKVFPGR